GGLGEHHPVNGASRATGLRRWPRQSNQTPTSLCRDRSVPTQSVCVAQPCDRQFSPCALVISARANRLLKRALQRHSECIEDPARSVYGDAVVLVALVA